MTDVPSGPPDPVAIDADTAARWARVRRLANLMDSAFEVPGTNRRFGIDGVIGLLPGVGDVAGLVVAAVVVGESVRIGARGWVLARMLLIIAADALVGFVPVAGWVFDFVFKANQRNVRLLEEHVTDPDAARARARRTVLWSVLAVVVATAVVVLLVVALTAWLWARVVG